MPHNKKNEGCTWLLITFFLASLLTNLLVECRLDLRYSSIAWDR
jgi:hypothetical protein